jgi:hypothetical protein
MAGDVNDTPDSVALASLFNDGFVDMSIIANVTR